LSKTVAVVTGGASGLGAAATRHLLSNGARVVVADLSRDAYLQNVVDWCRRSRSAGGGVTSDGTRQQQQEISVLGEEEGGSTAGAGGAGAGTAAVAFAETDVTDAGQVTAALDLVESSFGEPVNAAISCAGIAFAQKTLGKKGPHSLEDFTRVLHVNAVGTFNVSRLAAERMATRNEPDDDEGDGLRGCIVNTASIAAYEGQVGQVAYAASKGAVVGMTLPMARDLAPLGIRVVAIVS